MGEEKEKEEKNKKKEYETIKIKRGKLEKTRDVFSIIRDFLIILVLIGLVLALVIIIQLLGNIQSTLQGGGLLGLLGGSGESPLGNLASLFVDQLPIGGGTNLHKVQGDAETCTTLSGLQGKLFSGDIQNVQSDIDKLEKTFKKNGWQEQSDTLAEIESSIQSGDFVKVLQSGPSLLNSIDCS